MAADKFSSPARGQWLAVIIVTASLSGCDTGSPEPQFIAEQKPATELAKPPGAHGAGNPHANLSPQKLIQVALKHYAEGRSALAMQTLDQAINQYPDFAPLYGVRGSLKLEQENVASALTDLDSAIRLAPDSPEHLVNRSQAYRKFKRDKEAMADLNRAVELNQLFLAARFNRGSLAFTQGDLEKALEDFDACVAIDPHVAAPYFNRAAIYDAMGNQQLAISDLERFIQISPSEAWTDTANELIEKWHADMLEHAPTDQAPDTRKLD